MSKTFAYLILTIFKNRLVTMARRVKRPRYAIGLIFGLAYMVFFIFGQDFAGRESRAGVLQNDTARSIAPVLLLLVLATTWFGGATLNALAFTQAEVAMLFPAPVSRRALVLYKLGTAQLPIIINALILAYIFGRGPAAIPRWLAVISLWVTFSTLHLHRLGAALTFAATAEHGTAGFKRNWFSHAVGLLIFVTIMGVFATTTYDPREAGSSPLSVIGQLAAPLSHPAVQVVLFPFTLILAPAFSRTIGEWALAMGPALLLLMLHLAWVLRSQTAFEEAAVEASMRRQQIIDSWRKRGGTGSVRKAKEGRTIQMGSTGHPAIAIIWKNTLCFMRTFRPLQVFVMMGVPILAGGYFGMKAGEGAATLAGICAVFAFVMLLVGGATVRNDLRADMLNLDQLKTLPLRGREIVLAEVASSALPLALIQLALLNIGMISLQLSKHPLSQGLATSILISLPFGIMALNLAISTIRNGAAVLFPSWTRLGVEAQGPGGFEVIGQAMLSMLAMFLTFLVLMILPAAVTLFVTVFVQPPAALAIVFSVIVGAIALTAESYGLIAWLGRVFERAEPSASLTAS